MSSQGRLFCCICVFALLFAVPLHGSAQSDDILDDIEAELEAELEAKKKAEKIEKDKEKYEAKYRATITKAQAYFRDKKYEDALETFKEAKEYDPLNPYPDEQIAIVQEEIKRAEEERIQAEKEQQYASAMTEGNGALDKQKYDDAIAAFERAAKILPDKGDAQQAVTKAKKAKEAFATQQQYKEKIDQADGLLSDSKYAEAISAYQAAAKLKPAEGYPAEKIKEAKQLQKKAEEAAALAKKEAEYSALLEKGDDLLKSEKFDEAIAEYTKAKAVFPAKTEATTKIDEAKAAQKAAKDKALRDKYDAVIDEADKLLSAGEYDNAKAKYKEALTVLPNENYPKEKIKETEEQKLAAEREKTKAIFDQLIAEGDDLLKSDDFDQAANKYKEAQKVLPEDPTSKQKLDELERLKNDAKAREEKAAFDKLIAEGDDLLNSSSFEEAKAKYLEAAKILPADPQPEQKIAALAEAKKAKELEETKEKYDALISEGDAMAKDGNYDNAISKYNEASALLPSDGAAKEKIAQAEAMKADAALAEKRNAYNEKVNQGKDLLSNKSFEEARNAFKEAQAILPEEAEAKELLAQVDDAEKANELEETKAKYDGLLAEGDALAKEGDYEAAIAKYQEAKPLLPSESAATGKIAQAEAMKADAALAEKRNAYNEKVNQGKDLLSNKSFDDARNAFKEAQAILPEESEAKELLAQVDEAEKANELEETKAKYDGLLAEGDALAKEGDYEAAIAKYQQAKPLLPSESAATEKIAQAEAMKNDAALAEKRNAYNEKVNQGKSLLSSNSFAEARSAFTEAKAILPDDPEASKLLAQVDEAEAKATAAANEAEKEIQYLAKISESEAALSANSFDKAEQLAQEAATLYPTGAKHSALIAQIGEKKAAYEAEQQALQSQQNEAEQKAAFQAKIDEGNSAMNAGQWSQATTAFNAAKAMNIDNELVDKQLAELTDKQAFAEKQQALDQYTRKIETATRARGKQDWEKAKAAYEEARGVMPDKSGDIDQLLAGMAQERKAIEEQNQSSAAEEEAAKKAAALQALLQEGRDAVQNNNTDLAEQKLSEAKAIDPTHEDIERLEEQIATAKERLEAQRLAEEKKKAATNQQEALKQQFTDAISEGDKSVAAGDYDKAISTYNEALSLGIDNGKAEQKIVDAERAQRDAAATAQANEKEAELQAQFDALMKQGNSYFDNYNYDKAIASFEKAADVLPNNSTSAQRIADAKSAKAQLEKELAEEARKKKEAQLAANRAKQRAFKEENIDNSPERLDKVKFMNDLGKNYPQGVTEEMINEDKYDVTRRVVVNSGVGAEYLKVQHDWGGVFYFKNGKSTSQWIWQIETSPAN